MMMTRALETWPVGDKKERIGFAQHQEKKAEEGQSSL